MDPDLCSRYVYGGSLTSPPEQCDEPAEPGEELCAEHLHEEYGDDEAYDRARDIEMERLASGY